jgi:hypothetical protein
LYAALPKTSQATQAYERLFASQIEWRSFYPLLAAIVAYDMRDLLDSDPSHIFDGDMPTTFTSERVFVLVLERTNVGTISTFLAHSQPPFR